MLTCVVVPHYEHVDQFRKYLPSLVEQGYPLVVVDDASRAETFEKLERLLFEHAPDTVIVRHEENKGKGGAVISGLEAAYRAGYSHAVQVDADGQHDAMSLKKLVDASEAFPDSIVCGEPVFDHEISVLRYYFRHLTLYLTWVESLSTEIRDAMCGLRVYPLSTVLHLVAKGGRRNRMDFDPEILVRAVWAGIRLHYIPVQVRYPESGLSHFQYFRDNVIISWMHTRLLFGMVARSPWLLFSKLRKLGDGNNQ